MERNIERNLWINFYLRPSAERSWKQVPNVARNVIERKSIDVISSVSTSFRPSSARNVSVRWWCLEKDPDHRQMFHSPCCPLRRPPRRAIQSYGYITASSHTKESIVSKGAAAFFSRSSFKKLFPFYGDSPRFLSNRVSFKETPSNPLPLPLRPGCNSIFTSFNFLWL